MLGSPCTFLAMVSRFLPSNRAASLMEMCCGSAIYEFVADDHSVDFPKILALEINRTGGTRDGTDSQKDPRSARLQACKL
jgi:hypothetical protein